MRLSWTWCTSALLVHKPDQTNQCKFFLEQESFKKTVFSLFEVNSENGSQLRLEL